MKKMKKVFAGLLAATMVMSMAMTAFADEAPYVAQEDEGIRVVKTYTVNSGKAPHETFNFNFVYQSYKNGDGKAEILSAGEYPEITGVTLSTVTSEYNTVAKDGVKTTTTKDTVLDPGVYTLTKYISIPPEKLSKYKIGTYTYKVTEIPGSTSGVTYSNEELYLVLTIYRDEESSNHYIAAMHYQTANGSKAGDGFNNEYDAGKLIVGKNIVGKMADMTKTFDFTVILKDSEDDEILSDIKVMIKKGADADAVEAVEDSDYTKVVSENKTTATYQFKLGHGYTMEFENIPDTVTYKVYENKENYVQYDVTLTDAEDATKTVDETNGIVVDGVISEDASSTDEITYTNELDTTVDTGIILDSAPYVLLFALAAAGMFVVVNKKREEEF